MQHADYVNLIKGLCRMQQVDKDFLLSQFHERFKFICN